jgi:hypothetical protein
MPRGDPKVEASSTGIKVSGTAAERPRINRRNILPLQESLYHLLGSGAITETIGCLIAWEFPNRGQVLKLKLVPEARPVPGLYIHGVAKGAAIGRRSVSLRDLYPQTKCFWIAFLSDLMNAYCCFFDP